MTSSKTPNDPANRATNGETPTAPETIPAAACCTPATSAACCAPAAASGCCTVAVVPCCAPAATACCA